VLRFWRRARDVKSVTLAKRHEGQPLKTVPGAHPLRAGVRNTCKMANGRQMLFAKFSFPGRAQLMSRKAVFHPVHGNVYQLRLLQLGCSSGLVRRLGTAN
jgi:hypothetical protein